LPRLGDKRLQQNHHAHAKSGTQQHQFAPFSIRQAAPQRRDRRRNDKGDAEGQPRPQAERFATANAKLFKVERQKRNDLADRQAGKKAAKPDRNQVNFPGFNYAWHQQKVCRKEKLKFTAPLTLSTDKTWHRR